MVALEMAHSVSAARVRPMSPKVVSSYDQDEYLAGSTLTCSFRSMFAHLAHQLRDGTPITLTTGPIQLIEVVGSFGLRRSRSVTQLQTRRSREKKDDLHS